MRSFLWTGSNRSGHAKVSWAQVCKPTEEGGLGIRSVLLMNQALILKQVWRILQEDPRSIWVAWVLRHRLRHQTVWTFNVASAPWLWKKLIKICSLLKDGLVYRLAMEPHSPRVSWHKLLGGKFKIPRHDFILWLAVLGRLTTMDRLWAPNLDRRCVLCGGLAMESHSHLFFDCSFARRCLVVLKQGVRFPWLHRGWEQDVLWASRRWRGKHLLNAAYRALFASIVYGIWA
ncbi:UNVERIFIED_CONTAM: hypothetical protein Sradi_7290000 [Sesamum radiatum]|uniref:Reverse transcriptase zinc-binding domain-containing protein n=1 Tax=Sesamum radiatum TaxID=300843 RepID=A0AAW2IJJ8_SESRA